jgi:glycosyltransferase involved in cell wall biosynthesis
MTIMSGSTSDQPLISICMPVFNAERFLDEAVESIRNQTLGEFEFLILDDGSTDGSLRMLERHAGRDPRIRVTSRPNKGVAASLNDLVDQARGEFLARMDADDIAMRVRLAILAAFLRAHPDCVLVGSRVCEIDADGDPISEYFTLEGHEAIDAHHFLMRGPALIHPSVMMRRDVVLAVGKYRPFPMEDLDLFLRLAEHGRLARVPEVLLMYRAHAQNVSRGAKHFERAYTNLCQILTDAYRRRGLPVTLPPPPEPPSPISSSFEQDFTWAWRSLTSGHPGTARKYARRVLASRPLSPDSWKLMYCTLRGH